MEGQGLYVYGNGDMYSGSFSAGKRHGQGSYHFKAMVCQLVGEWVDGGFVQGRWIMKDGSMFYGSFQKQVTPVSGYLLQATGAGAANISGMSHVQPGAEVTFVMLELHLS
eukprot:scaffold18704_cov15-Tisochrysis_lutea.AAC.1